jgi:hypothetical protein
VFYFYSYSKRDIQHFQNENKLNNAKKLIERELGVNYNNWPLKEEGGSYHLWCIASKDIHYHTPHINLGDDYVVTHSIPCQYYDAQGQEQIVYIPAIIFNLEKDLYQFIGRKPVIGEDAKNLFDGYTGHFSDTGPVNIIKRGQGYAGAGQIMIINLDHFDDSVSSVNNEHWLKL